MKIGIAIGLVYLKNLAGKSRAGRFGRPRTASLEMFGKVDAVSR